jgi:hypothetical protein
MRWGLDSTKETIDFELLLTRQAKLQNKDKYSTQITSFPRTATLNGILLLMSTYRPAISWPERVPADCRSSSTAITITALPVKAYQRLSNFDCESRQTSISGV